MQMVLHHVAQRAGAFVVRGAALDADGLGGGDLHVIDVAPVPDRLEHAVGEAEHQQVLDGLLAEVVIDAKDLIFVEVLVRRADSARVALCEVGAERLLDDDAAPAAHRGAGDSPASPSCSMTGAVRPSAESAR